MLTKDKARMMIYCGCLHDIAEKCIDRYTKPQLKELCEKIESLLLRDVVVKSELNKIETEVLKR